MEGTGSRWEEEHPQAARKLEALKHSLDLALHSYLTSCTVKEFHDIFARFSRSYRNKLWTLYTHVVAEIHESCQKQLWNTVKEHKVAEFLLYHEELERIGGGHAVTVSDGQDKLQAVREKLCIGLANKVKQVRERAEKLEADNALATRLLDIRREEVWKQIEMIRLQCEPQTDGVEEVEGWKKAMDCVIQLLKSKDAKAVLPLPSGLV